MKPRIRADESNSQEYIQLIADIATFSATAAWKADHYARHSSRASHNPKLVEMFIWAATAEGWQYWARVAGAVRSLRNWRERLAA
jgi:hypothetical protein